MTGSDTGLDGDLRFRRAGPEDLDTVLEILEEARQRLISRGITEQWPAPVPSEVMRLRIVRGEECLAFEAGARDEAVGTFCVLRSDSKVWGEVPPEAIYVHGLAIRPAVSGRGIGAGLLELAGRLASEMGRKRVRLDCWAGNAALCRYYDGLGFRRRGAVDLGGGFVVQRYERPAHTGDS